VGLQGAQYRVKTIKSKSSGDDSDEDYVPGAASTRRAASIAGGPSSSSAARYARGGKAGVDHRTKKHSRCLSDCMAVVQLVAWSTLPKLAKLATRSLHVFLTLCCHAADRHTAFVIAGFFVLTGICIFCLLQVQGVTGTYVLVLNGDCAYVHTMCTKH
jgi:hypothetical protein